VHKHTYHIINNCIVFRADNFKKHIEGNVNYVVSEGVRTEIFRMANNPYLKSIKSITISKLNPLTMTIMKLLSNRHFGWLLDLFPIRLVFY
jgi:hypothetical protein